MFNMAAFRRSHIRLLTRCSFEELLSSGRFSYATKAVPSEHDVKGKLRSVKDIPGPSAIYQIPFIGFAFHLKPFSKYGVYQVSMVFYEMYKKYGPIYRQQLRNKQVVFLCDPDDIQEALRHEGTYPQRPAIGLIPIYNKRNNRPRGLTALDGEEWAKIRKPAQQNILRPITIARYFPLMSEVSDDFVQKLKDLSVVSDVRTALMAFAIENAAYLAFNRRIGCLEENSKLSKHFNDFFHLLGRSFFVAPLYNLFRTKLYREFEVVANVLYNLVDDEVEKAITKLKEVQKTGLFDPDKDPNLLHQLLSDPRLEGMNDVKIIILAIFIAGGETTASTMTFLLYQLAKNKHVQDKLYEEVQRHLPPDGVLTEAALKKMSYVKACLKESMRCTFPLVAGIERVLADDMVAKGYLIPKGTTVNLQQNLSVTRNPQLFPEPDVFNPDRWLRDGGEDRQKHSFALLPFGFGPRSCVGQRFAETEIHIGLAKIVQHLEISLVHPSKEYDVLWKPFPDTTEPVALKFIPRK